MKKLLEKTFPKSERESIITAVKQAEKKSSGEIVPMIVGGSSQYNEVKLKIFHLLFNGILFLVFSISLILKFSLGKETIAFTPLSISLFTLAVLALNFILFQISTHCLWLKKFFILPKQMEKRVLLEAETQFFKKGIQNTRDKTGILIYISIYEKKVIILADEGINNRVPQDYWQLRVNEIINGIKTGRATLSLTNTITEIGNELQKYFPIRIDDEDELENLIVE